MTQGRALILALTAAATAAELAALGITSRLDVQPPFFLVVLFTVVFCVTGALALARRPDNRIGWLLYAAGIAFAATGLPLSTNGVVFTVGLMVNSAVFAVIVHLVLAYPSGTLDERERRLTQSAYVLALVGPTLPLFWSRDPAECDCGDNVLFVHDSPRLYGLTLHSVQLLAALLLVGVVVQLVRRWRRASPAYRRAVRAVYVAGGLAVSLLGLSLALQAVWKDGSTALVFGSVAAAGAMPVIVLAGLLGPSRARALVGRVVSELGPVPAPGHLRDVLRAALHDPALEVGYWLPDLPGYVDIEGRPFVPADADAATFVDGEEGRIGVITHDRALLEESTVLDGVVSAVRLVLENERLHADLRAKLVEIQQQQRFTDLVVDNAPAFFVVIDGDGRVRGGANDPLLRLFAITHRDEIADRFFWELFCVPEEAEQTKARLAQVAAGHDLGPQEAKLPVPDDEVRVVEWRDTIVPDEQGQLKWIVRSGLDVTERKQQADEQAALRRVATVVAEHAGFEKLVQTVTREVAALFGAQTAAIVRLEEEHVRLVEEWSPPHLPRVAPGTMLPVGEGDTALGRALDAREPRRIDSMDDVAPGAGRQFWVDFDVISAIAAPIVVAGEVWGGISATRGQGAPKFPPHAEDRLGDMAALVAQALANVAARDELSASRARIVQAADEARRKLERNLHDGAQQRLVSLSITLRLAEGKLESAPDEAREALRGAAEELGHALAELRELARGIHPAILSDRGLGPALHALADRATLPVTVVDEVEDRLPDAVEAAAYFVVSESLANVAKHAQAESAVVHVERRDGYARVEVDDDGIGGADPRGSGLRGLFDRVEALEGRLGVETKADGGTRVWAEFPC